MAFCWWPIFRLISLHPAGRRVVGGCIAPSDNTVVRGIACCASAVIDETDCVGTGGGMTDVPSCESPRYGSFRARNCSKRARHSFEAGVSACQAHTLLSIDLFICASCTYISDKDCFSYSYSTYSSENCDMLVEYRSFAQSTDSHLTPQMGAGRWKWL